jgi:hypothetical protein
VVAESGAPTKGIKDLFGDIYFVFEPIKVIRKPQREMTDYVRNKKKR